jgi:hypothetical protein
VAVVAAVLVLAAAGWVLGHGLALACASARWGGGRGMPPRVPGVCAGGALAASGAAGCLVVAERLARLAG